MVTGFELHIRCIVHVHHEKPFRRPAPGMIQPGIRMDVVEEVKAMVHYARQPYLELVERAWKTRTRRRMNDWRLFGAKVKRVKKRDGPEKHEI